MPTNIAPGTKQQPWLAWLKHRRAFFASGSGPVETPGVFTDEAETVVFTTEDGIDVFVTEGSPLS